MRIIDINFRKLDIKPISAAIEELLEML